MDKETSRSIIEVPVQISDDGSVYVPEQLHYDADGTVELKVIKAPTKLRCTSTTKGGAVIGCGTPPLSPHELFCARRRAAAADAAAASAAAAAVADAEDDFADEGDDHEEVPTDAQVALALRAVYARHRHDLTITWRTLMQKAETEELGGADLSTRRQAVYERHRHNLTLTWRTLMRKTETELGGADLSTRRHVIKTTIALIKHEEAEAARGRQADHKPTTPVKVIDDDEEVPTDAQVALALRAVYARRHRHDLTITWRTLMQKAETELGGADLSTRRHVVKTTIALIKHEEAEAARGRQADNAPTTPVKKFDDDDSFHPEKEVEDPFLVELAVAVAAPWDSGEASAAAAAAAVGLRQQLQWMIGDAAPADASATGQTYNDITKSPPPYLRCVFSPLSSLPPVLRCTASSLPHFFVADAGVEAGSGRALREDVTRLFGP